MLGMIFVFLFLEDVLHDAIWRNKPGIIDWSVPLLLSLGVIVVGAFIRQMLHAVCIILFAKNGFKSVSCNLITLSPACRSLEPLTRGQYSIVLIIPLLVLGVIPLVGAYYLHQEWLRSFGLLFTIISGSDLILFFILLFQDNRFLYQEHPDKKGFFMMKRGEARR